MNTKENTGGHSTNVSFYASILLLLIHLYYYCHGGFKEWHLTFAISDRLLDNFSKTWFLKYTWSAKLLVLVFLILSSLGSGARKDEKYTHKKGFLTILIGIVPFFGSVFLLSLDATWETRTIAYICFTAIGYFIAMTGIAQLFRVLPYSLRKAFIEENNDGFEQESRLIKTAYSLNLPARYQFQGRLRKSYINIINPRRGILIMGSPGSGKSWFIIEPMIGQLIEKGFACCVYDFKYPALTEIVYHKFQQHRDKYPDSAQFYNINFTDLSRSHRCNLIDPLTLTWLSDAIGVSRTILLSMNKTWLNHQGDFFVESPVNFLAAVIWYLRKYKDGIYCTLPHAIELAQMPYDKLFTLLNTEPEIQSLINPFVEAYRNKTMEMLDSQVSSAKIPLGRLASPDLYYILTGNDLSLNINAPNAPKILCLGGDPSRQEALAPVLSLYLDRLNKLINQKGRHPCALVFDEFATVRAYSVQNTIATARSNNIITILAMQDLSQLRTQYSRDEADQILNITGNLICGPVGDETARRISDRFPATLKYRRSVSVNSHDTSINRSEQESRAISPSTIANLSSGEFVGIVADDPDQKIELKAFHAHIIKDEKESDKKYKRRLPLVRELDNNTIEDNFQGIKREVEALVASEWQRILGDPVLSKKIVKR